MNKTRLAEIKKISAGIEVLKDNLQSILIEEEWAFESMPENLQGSERGDRSQDAQEYLNEAIDKLGEAIEQLDDIM